MSLARAWRAAAAVLAAAVLGGCATAPDTEPLLRLPPAALGGSLNQQQQITVEVEGREPQRMEVLLEADAQAVRVALLALGRTVARLDWDGRELRQERAAWWPAQVAGERVLSELQLALWPVPALRAALPPGWTLQEEAPGLRRLCRSGEPVIEVRRQDAHRLALVHLRAGYRLLIESQDLQEATP
ncbi:DUF3261 domain-containing protein [Azohydromonas lata]|uniref:DUF3261 domain-containing protein n=1 Tax=Azohydromonas lata TaxID=45677 RepID=A0ABU5IKN6_9BURK|nr:DUF3261 domain-containing protein [Azohydromonas lata]MDZ5459465.1 DUF3261 domain-containing protein [Azohydromonas lata]